MNKQDQLKEDNATFVLKTRLLTPEDKIVSCLAALTDAEVNVLKKYVRMRDRRVDQFAVEAAKKALEEGF